MMPRNPLTPQPNNIGQAIGAPILRFALKVLMVRIRLLPTVIFFSILLLGVKVHHVTHKINTGFDLSMETVRAGEAPAPSPSPATPAQGAISVDPSSMSAAEYNLLQEMEMKKGQGAVVPAAAAGAVMDTKVDGATPAGTVNPKQPAVLTALEKRMDETVKQLNSSKTELNKLVKSIDQEENANTKRLIKMVEGMKAEQASKVLEGIEFMILLEIMEGMSEKKASLILASMSPQKASYLMTALAKRKKIIKKDSPEKGVMVN